jgi:23S rRNA pseudouridine1911/1915/1917 synthase
MAERSEETPSGRLDIYIAKRFPQVSRAFVQRLIDDQRVKVNGVFEKAGYKLRPTDKVQVDFEPAELDQIPSIDLPVIYEDNNVIVIDKPVGVISHSRGKYWNEPSVASFIRERTGQVGERSGIVHRLDRATSGVMICAKNQTSLSWLQRQFSTRKVKKAYLAIISGHLEPKEAVIEMPVERNPKAPATFRVGQNGKPATTIYRVTESNSDYDLVRLEPLTGRTHQLRVHLAHQKHPIVGDVLYGGENYERLLLHALSLEITLPNRDRKLFEASAPEIFKTFLGRKDG